MKCTVLQRRLLALDHPDRPPAEMQAHLTRCAACRAWQRRVVELDRRVPLLPVPPSTARSDLVKRILAGGRRPSEAELRGQRRDRGIRKLALATALAAGLALFALGWWTSQWPGPSVKPPVQDPLLARLLRHDLSLAEAPQPPRRLDTLSSLAEDLHGQVRSLAEAGAADDLQALAQLYGQVVREGILRQAQAVPAADRERAAQRLAGAAAKAEELAAELDGACVAPVRDIAATARAGEAGLRADASRAPTPVPPRQLLSAESSAVRRCLRIPVAASLIVAVSAVQPHLGESPSAQQAQHFRKSLHLIRGLVKGGLELAREDDPLKRAVCCNSIAQSLAGAMKTAAADGDGGRMAELSQHLRAVLQRGVAANLSTARIHVPAGSAEEQSLQQVRQDTADCVLPLKAQLQQDCDGAAVDDLKSALAAIDEGWAVVQKSLPGPGTRP